MGVNDELAEVWTELVMVYFKVLVLNDSGKPQQISHNSQYSS
jgi:hypothetical protein